MSFSECPVYLQLIYECYNTVNIISYLLEIEADDCSEGVPTVLLVGRQEIGGICIYKLHMTIYI